jgi:hypothetical protein
MPASQDSSMETNILGDTPVPGADPISLVHALELPRSSGPSISSAFFDNAASLVATERNFGSESSPNLLTIPPSSQLLSRDINGPLAVDARDAPNILACPYPGCSSVGFTRKCDLK